jgi:hypothetical protein
MAVISNGTTLIDNGILDAAVPTGKMILLSTQTASASATISFTSGIDSTYDSYVFKFINIHPETNEVKFQFNFSTDSGSNYNVTKTTTAYNTYHNEAGTDAGLGYNTGADLAESTGFQRFYEDTGSDNDQASSGYLQLFNPSSEIFVKHFVTRFSNAHHAEYMQDWFIAGYGNTTSAVDAVRFQMDSGNIDSGVIKLYGIGG